MVPSSENHGAFRTTHWSLIVEAADSASPASNQALEQLYLAYWKPLYTFLRRKGHSSEDSQDLVQGLFAHLMEKRNFFKKADPNQGQFRSFLLGALKHFASDQQARSSAQKRGGGVAPLPLDISDLEESITPLNDHDPTVEFDRHWAMTVLSSAIHRLRARATKGKPDPEFDLTFSYISGKAGQPAATLAQSIGISEDAFKMKASRLRTSLRDSLRQVVAETVANPAEIDSELAYLQSLMKKSL